MSVLTIRLHDNGYRKVPILANESKGNAKKVLGTFSLLRRQNGMMRAWQNSITTQNKRIQLADSDPYDTAKKNDFSGSPFSLG